jgi:hypothetical protein
MIQSPISEEYTKLVPNRNQHRKQNKEDRIFILCNEVHPRFDNYLIEESYYENEKKEKLKIVLDAIPILLQQDYNNKLKTVGGKSRKIRKSCKINKIKKSRKTIKKIKNKFRN